MSGAPWPVTSAFFEWLDASGTTNNLTFDCITSEDWDNPAEITEHPVEVGADITDHIRVKLVKCTLKIFSTNEPMDLNNFTAAVLAPLPLAVPTVQWLSSPQTLTYPTWVNNITERALAATAGGLLGSAAGGPLGGAIGSIGVAALSSLLFAPHAATSTQGTDAGQSSSLIAPTISPVTQQWPSGTDFVEATHALMCQLKDNAQIIDVFGTKQTQYSMAIEELSTHRDKDTGTGEELTVTLKQVRFVTTGTVPLPIANLSTGGTPPVSHGAQNPTPAKPASILEIIKQVATGAPGAPAVSSVLPSIFGGA